LIYLLGRRIIRTFESTSMEPNAVNPQGEKPATPRAKGGRARKNVLEFEFAKSVLLPPADVPVVPSETKTKPVQPAPKAPVASSVASSPVPKVVTSEPLPTKTVAHPVSTASAPLAKAPAPLSQPQPKPTTMSNQPLKPSTITDFKRNVDQQKKEQKSFNNVLSTITYVVLIGLILVTGLAGYGAHQFWMRLNDQATSITTLDQKLDTAVLGINEDLHRTKAELEKTTAEISHQQEEISILRSSLDKLQTDAKADRAARARENAALQKRLADLENRSR
jgi:hypothetical protein